MYSHIAKIDPAFKGEMIPEDLFKAEATLAFSVMPRTILHGGVIFHVEYDRFRFIMSFQNKAIVLQRCEVVSILDVSEFLKSSGEIRVVGSWSLTELTLGCRTSERNMKIARIPTPAIAPPIELLKWARKQNLLRKVIYSSEEEFRGRVYSILISLNEKISKTDAFKGFWNIIYKDNKIISKEPKKEIEIQPLIHCLLSDQMILNGIEVIPEYPTGVGNVDFVFMANVSGIGMTKMCIEFKLAHSKDLRRGLLHQLPAYMVAAQVKYGAYCVLNFKGKEFDKPNLGDTEDIVWHVNQIGMSVNNPILDNIRSIVIDLAKPTTASKI